MKQLTLTADTEVTVSLGFLLKFGMIITLLHVAPDMLSHMSAI